MKYGALFISWKVRRIKKKKHQETGENMPSQSNKQMECGTKQRTKRIPQTCVCIVNAIVHTTGTRLDPSHTTPFLR